MGASRSFVKKGDRVVIKVNICGGVPEIKGTFTGTEVVGELSSSFLRSVGAEPWIVDSDMIWTKFWQAASDLGLGYWAKKKGVRLLNLADTRARFVDFGNESAVGVERISKELVDADVIISVPVMKTHLLTGVTLSMKNMCTFPDIDKAKFHRKTIENVIYEINLAFTPNLTIIDGSIGGEAIGPLSCTPLNFQTIIASNDVVTADAIACQLMGYDPMDINHLKNHK